MIKSIRMVLLALLTGVAGAAAAPNPTATVSWSAPTTNTDGTAITDPITYSVYQIAPGQTPPASPPYSGQIATAISVTSYTVANAVFTNGQACYFVTATDDTDLQEGSASGVGCKVLPKVPSAPSAVTVK